MKIGPLVDWRTFGLVTLVAVTLTGGVVVGLAPASQAAARQATVSLTPPAVPSPGILAPPDKVVGAFDGSVSLPVTLNAPGESTVTVSYATANGTAGSNTSCIGSDYSYVGKSGTLTFTPGVTSQVVTVNLLNCGISFTSGFQTFTFNLSSATNGTIVRSSTQIDITGDAATSSQQGLFVRDAVVDATAGSVSVPVLLGGPSGAAEGVAVTVPYTTNSGSAVAGTDFSTTSGTLTFPAGETAQNITVPILERSGAAAARSFTVTLGTPTNATVSDGTGVVTIGASGATAVPSPNISAPPDIVVGEADGYVDLPVTLSAPAESTVTVNDATENGTAGANTGCIGSDYSYVGTNGALNFTPGVTTQVVRVDLLNCGIANPGTFTLNLSSAVHGTIIRATVTVTIVGTPTVPEAPTSVVATAGNQSASVAFSAPASDGGNDINTYTVKASPGGVSATGPGTPITVTGLTNGTPYTFTVTATNDVGTGPSSSPSNSVTPSQVLLTPTTPVISNLPGAAAFGGSFTAIVSTNGDGTKSVTSNSTGICTVSGLVVTYVGVGTCSLTAMVAAGTVYSAASGTAQTFTVSPAMPTSPVISNLPGSAAFGGSFTATVSTNGDGTKSVTSNSTGISTVSGFVVSFVGVGTCSLTAHVGTGTDYLAANGTAQTFSVSPATPTTPTISNLPGTAFFGGSFTATVSTYGDGTKSVTSNSTGNCTVNGFVVTYVGVGICSLTAHVGAGTDYTAANGTAQTFSASQATPTTPTISNLPTSGFVGSGFTATVSTNGDGAKSVTSNSTGICTTSGVTVTDIAVGTCSLTAHVATGTDYSAANGTAQSFIVTATPGPYSPLTPTRICDTRSGNPSGLTGAAAQCNGSTLGAGSIKTINLVNANNGGLGSFGVPADATAVVLNVTAVSPAAAGYLTVYAAGASQPVASNLNYVAGEVVPNLVEVGVGTSGDVDLFTSAMTNVIVDVEGYTSATASGGAGAGLYNPLASPVRICDTRAGNPSKLVAPNNQCNGGSGNPGETLPAGGAINVMVANIKGIPPGATAAVFNITVVNPRAAGFLMAYPQGSTRPVASNVNYTAGQVTSNRVVVSLSSSGTTPGYLSVYSSSQADVIVDVSGYYTAAGGTGSVFNVEPDPVRICDTRAGNPSGLTGAYNQCDAKTIGPGDSLTINVTGLAGIPMSGSTAVVVNLTGVAPTAPTFLTVYPSALPSPLVSDLNEITGDVRANLVVATLNPTNGTITVYNSAGTTNVVVDVLGWYSQLAS